MILNPSIKNQSGSQLKLIYGALGIVFGDIATSPLFALKAVFSGGQAIAVNPHNVVGVLSLVLWSLIIVVGIKYAILMMRADNRGEGGIMALMALALRKNPAANWLHSAVLMAGLVGTALFFGDSIIAPAITVMSAVEGLTVMSPKLGAFVTPLTLLVLTFLFLLQSRGTAFIAGIFSPVMCLWLLVIASMGAVSIYATPEILIAFNPLAALEFLIEAKKQSHIVLGAVVLVVTGAEALYADLGHFGVKPIRLGWFGFVFPALVLNYFGQGALMLREPAAAGNPFFLLVPAPGVFPLLVLATLVTVIASQAVISGAFSLARQAIQLGYLPRLRYLHTSSGRSGQIYIPSVNWILWLMVTGLVLFFESSQDLAGAYGAAVTGTMFVSTVLAFSVFGLVWNFGPITSWIIAGFFLLLDLFFLAANLLKISSGGWFALLAAALMFVVMSTWKKGRVLLVKRLNERAMPLELLLADMADHNPVRVPGTAVYLTAGRRGVPPALQHNFSVNKVLHERVVILTVVTRDEPWVPVAERIKVKHFGEQIYRAKIYFGFNEVADVPEALSLAAAKGLSLSIPETSFFLARESLVPSSRSGMAKWRERLFIFLARNAENAMTFWRIPPDRVIEFGVMVDL